MTPAGDPTQNVIALTEASHKRQDDLRDANNRYLDAEFRRLEQLATLREKHAGETATIETKRLDAIRQVDALAVKTAYDQASAAIQTLAATTVTNAENLRNALNTTATTIAVQQANTVQAITDRLAALEKSSYEGAGRAKVGDPLLTELANEVKLLREAHAQGTGQVSGVAATWGLMLGAGALISTIISLLTWIAHLK